MFLLYNKIDELSLVLLDLSIFICFRWYLCIVLYPSILFTTADKDFKLKFNVYLAFIKKISIINRTTCIP